MCHEDGAQIEFTAIIPLGRDNSFPDTMKPFRNSDGVSH